MRREPCACRGIRACALDTSDYYVVILAGRYGSIDPTVGVSWTEREYRYAKDRGLRQLAYIRKDRATPLLS